MTANDFGMGNPAHDPAPDVPQTARSIGMGPVWADLADVVDLASLAAGRRRHAYRMAADAIDYLVALLDALDAHEEDLEDGHDAEHDTADAESWLGWPNAFTSILDVSAPHDLDLEDVNEDGGGQYDDPWWERSSPARMDGAVHV